jgi:transposase
VVYEAGPTGFALARKLNAAGVRTDVIAPGMIPQVAVRSYKTDSMDAAKLAEYSSKGMLHTVKIPTEDEEADRQVLRLREQIVGKMRRVKQQIKSFLLQHGLNEPEGLSTWTNASVFVLKELPLDRELRFCLDVMLDELAHQKAHLKKVTDELKRLSREDRYNSRYKIVTSHPGVGIVCAMTFMLEVYRSGGRMFSKSGVGRYTGLAPLVRSTGRTRIDCGIVRTGRGALRSMLVEAAWVWVYRDPAAKKVYGRLVSNTGSGKKAIVGMARRLAVRLYVMLENGEEYRKAS